MSSLRTGIKVVQSDMEGSGLQIFRVLENENVEILNEKLIRLRVYEKGGSLVFKNSLFISQLVDLALHLTSQQHCPRVCFTINALSRKAKIVVAT